ncbi:MAG: glycerophosphodiester phosphodiesterase family protein [Desulfuromonadales bacterium]|nr:glycerophosphodiester phosphodiesterase family protein [Desulfuromonadales bacterium]
MSRDHGRPVMSRLLLWAHRGASAVAPENTLSAFAAACAAGADGLELDIQLSRDGAAVVLHDETVDRTTNGRGPVANFSLRELQRLDAGFWFSPRFVGERLPSLVEVLDAFAGRIVLNLEIKQVRAGLVVLGLLRRYPHAEVLISSFNWPLLVQLRRLDVSLPLAVLLETRDWHRAVAVAGQVDAVSLHPRADLVSRPLLAACRRLDLPVIPWTIDRPRQLTRLWCRGVAGVFTNDPGALRRVCP